MRKNVLAACMMVILAVCALAGCGGKKEVTAKSLLESVEKQTKEMKSMEAKVTMSMTMEGEDLSYLGGSMDVSMDMDMQTTSEPAANYMEGTMSMMGMNLDLKNYTVIEGDQICTYTNMMDQWVVQKIPYDQEAMEGLDTSASDLLASSDSLVLAEETKDVEGTEAYIITGTISGDSVQDIIRNASSGMSSVLGDAAQIDLSKVTVDVEYALSREDEKPLYTNMVFHGMESLTEGMNISFKDYTMNIKYTGFDTVDSITVPQEAIDNAQDLSALTGAGDTGLMDETDAGLGMAESDIEAILEGEGTESETAH